MILRAFLCVSGKKITVPGMLSQPVSTSFTILTDHIFALEQSAIRIPFNRNSVGAIILVNNYDACQQSRTIKWLAHYIDGAAIIFIIHNFINLLLEALSRFYVEYYRVTEVKLSVQ